MYLQPVPAPVAARRRGGGVLRRAPGDAVRVVGVDGPDQQGLRRRDRTGSAATRACRWSTSSRGSARTTWRTSTWPGSTGEEGVLFVGRAQEKTRVFRTEKRRNPRHRGDLSVDRAGHRDGQPLLRLLRRRATSARSSSSSARTSRTPPNCASTATSGPSGRRPRPGSGSPRLDNGFAACRRPGRGAGASATGCPRRRSTRCCVSGCGACRTRSPPPTGPPATATTSPILQAEFSLTQMLDRPATGRIFFEQVIRDNLDLGRPDQVGLVFDRRIITKGRTPHPGPVPHPGASPTGSPPACTSTTSTRRSSSTTRRAARYAPRRPSTTAATSASASGCATCPPCGRSASPPTDVCSTSNVSATTRPSAPTHSARRHQPRHRRRPARVRPALRRPPHPGPARRPGHLPPAAPRVPQPRPARPPGAPARPRPQPHDRGQHHLRPTPATPTTASSNASPKPTATPSPTTVCAIALFLTRVHDRLTPTRTWPTSPTPTRQPQHPSARPSTPSQPGSATSTATNALPHNLTPARQETAPQNLTHPLTVLWTKASSREFAAPSTTISSTRGPCKPWTAPGIRRGNGRSPQPGVGGDREGGPQQSHRARFACSSVPFARGRSSASPAAEQDHGRP